MQILMGMKRAMGARIGVFLLLGLILAACTVQPIQAPEPASEAEAATEQVVEEIPVVPIEITDDGLVFPDNVPSGIVSFSLANWDGPDFMPDISRLNDDVTFEEFLAAVEEDEEAAMSLITQFGSAWSETGDLEAEIVYELVPGTYVGVFFTEEENAPPIFGSFVAGDPSGATPPEADVVVELVDFSFVMPDQIPAGRHTWQIKNAGEQWHEMAIAQLNEGATIEDVIAFVDGGFEGEPPGQVFAGWSPMNAGNTAWVTWNLPAGEYIIVCILPDLKGDMAPHLAHGMMRNLVVTE